MTTLNEKNITGDIFVKGKIYEKNSTELDKIIPTDVGIKDNKLGLVHDSTWLTNQDAINLKGFDYNADTNTLALDSTTLNVINRAYLRPVTKPSVLDICAQDNTGGQVNVELGDGLSYDPATKKINATGGGSSGGTQLYKHIIELNFTGSGGSLDYVRVISTSNSIITNISNIFSESTISVYISVDNVEYVCTGLTSAYIYYIKQSSIVSWTAKNTLPTIITSDTVTPL